MTIAIIGAFDEEIEKLVNMYSLEKEDKKNIFTGMFNNKKLVVANSGIGKVNASSIAQYIIDKYNPNYIINSGCAGSLDKSFNIMDIIVSSYVTYHDFMPVRIMENQVPDKGKIKASDKLIEISKEAFKKLNINNYFIDSIATGDCFVTDENMRDNIKNLTGCSAVDMESACIGHVCKLNNVEFISIKTLSDFSDGNDDFEIEAAYKSSMIVKEMIELL